MVNLIDEMKHGTRRFGAGHFDLIVIDEAHRSVYRKYRAIFDYFDSYLVVLTATPRDEIDRDTYSLFELERGVPTDAYDLNEAVADGFLVPALAVSVPLKFQREGIRYDDLSDEEQEQWDALEWSEDGKALNKWLFNTDTADKVLAHVIAWGHGPAAALREPLYRLRRPGCGRGLFAGGRAGAGAGVAGCREPRGGVSHAATLDANGPDISGPFRCCRLWPGRERGR